MGAYVVDQSMAITEQANPHKKIPSSSILGKKPTVSFFAVWKYKATY